MAKGLTRIGVQQQEINAMPEGVAALLQPSPFENTGREDVDQTARRYLGALFSTESHPTFGPAESDVPSLKLKNVTEIGLTGTTAVEYEQMHRGLRIYGSRIVVELDSDGQLRAVSGQIASPENVDAIATISPAEASAIVKKLAGLEAHQALSATTAPELAYRYAENPDGWRLVYVFDNVVMVEPSPGDAGEDAGHDHSEYETYRVFIDAHNGELVAKIPTRHHAIAVKSTGLDDHKILHHFTGNRRADHEVILEDPDRRIRTLSMGFSDIVCGPGSLPGVDVISPTTKFNHASAVVAHANATAVYDFYVSVLKRNSLDGNGMEIVSAVDCLNNRFVPTFGGFGICKPVNPNQKEYRNAAWIRNEASPLPHLRDGMMIYGQRVRGDGSTRSYAESLDVVAHELTHGVTDYTSGLEYERQSGALSESYSDIIGVAVSNAGEDDIAKWNWEVGEEASLDGMPIRDISNPLRFGDPDHMDQFVGLAPGEDPSRDNDFGGVHTNSGIHNKAAFNLFSSDLFTWQEVVQMFYLTLITKLTPTAEFTDSKQGMVESCQMLFSSRDDLDELVGEVSGAFDAVGI